MAAPKRTDSGPRAMCQPRSVDPCTAMLMKMVYPVMAIISSKLAAATTVVGISAVNGDILLSDALTQRRACLRPSMARLEQEHSNRHSRDVNSLTMFVCAIISHIPIMSGCCILIF